MYETKSGKKYGSAWVGKKKDAMSPENRTMPTGEPAKASVPKEEPRTNESGEAKFSAAHAEAEPNDVKTSPEGVDPSAIASQHGPASSTTTHHSKDNHVVVSRHPDGHMNFSQHKSHKEAHKAAAMLSGEQHTENTDSPANEEQLSGGDLFGNDGFKVPHLA